MPQTQDSSYSLIDNRLFDKFEKDGNTIVMLIYLNRPFDFHTLHSLHNISACTLVADGAANRFYTQSKKASLEYQSKELQPFLTLT